VKKILISLSLLLTSCAAFAGTFEHLGGGVRYLGMAGAGVAVVDDASAVYWNPAGLMQLKRSEFTAARTDLYGLGLVSYDNYFYGHPGLGLGSVGFGIIKLGTTSKVDYMNFNETTMLFSFGMRGPADFLRNLSIGANMKYYKAEENTVGTGYGIDLGAQYKIKDYYLGAMVQDVNWPKIHFQSTQDDILPCNLRLGLGYKYQKNFSVAFDWDNFNEVTQFYGGMEKWFADRIIAVRLGFIKQDIKHWTYTMGLGIRTGGIQFDYAVKKHFDLDNTHSFAITLKI
jgi:hypothetical protein